MNTFDTRRSRWEWDESGFTLLEMLIGIVVMTIIMSAVAAALIVGLDNTKATEARLGGSSNAQVTSANFGQDVQGASYLTTSAAASNPSVCGSGSKLLVAMYRPSVTSNAATGVQAVNALSVGYWLVTSTSSPQIVRYACGATTTNTLISDDVNTLTQQIASITPAVFASAAAGGWAPVSALTTVTANTDLSASATIPVGSTAGFSMPGSVAIVTSVGTITVPCTGPVPPAVSTTFTGCTKTGQSTTAFAGAQVSQAASVSAVSLGVNQPAAAYTYALTAAPRAFSNFSYGSNGGGGINAPPLLISPSNSCSGLSWNGNLSIKVNGNIGLNSSIMGKDTAGSCTGGECKGGSGTFASSGFEATTGSPFNGCSFSGTSTTTTLNNPIPDPYANVVPTYPSAAFPQRTGASLISTSPGSTCSPGEYTNLAAFQSCTTLQPGVYILDGGWTQTVTESAAGLASGQGVLIYLPCNPPMGSPKICNEPTGTFNDLPGLTAVQAAQNLGTSALAGFAIWQDKGDNNPISLGGNGAVSTTGIIYVPTGSLSTSGTSSFTATSIIAYSLDISGGGHGGGQCNVDLCVTG